VRICRVTLTGDSLYSSSTSSKRGIWLDPDFVARPLRSLAFAVGLGPWAPSCLFWYLLLGSSFFLQAALYISSGRWEGT
jgi:hypothetical protein